MKRAFTKHLATKITGILHVFERYLDR